MLLVLFSVAIIAALGWKYFGGSKSQTVLEIDSGTVLRNGKTARANEVLVNGDTVQTSANTAATIIFASGSELRLDENTEVKITTQSETNTSVYQSLGRTWSRVLKLSGTESYEVETPTAVATVRGTAFSTTVDSDTGIDTDEGAVDVLQKASKRKLRVEAGFGTRVSRLQKEAVREEIKNGSWFKRNRERDKKIGQGVTLEDIRKIRNLVTKVRDGKLDLNEEQKRRLEPVARKLQNAGGKVSPQVAPDVAEALAIIDPENFGDIPHWTRIIQTASPLIEKFQLLKIESR